MIRSEHAASLRDPAWIYFDHHAATPLCAEAAAAMDEARADGWANPASTHAAGRRARALLEGARRRIANALGVDPPDLILTSGGTEAINLGLRGLHAAGAPVLTTEVEHPAVAATLATLHAEVVRRLPVPAGHPPAPDAVAAGVEPGTLVAIQWVNHETGTLFPVGDYAEVIRAQGGLLFVDATQAFGKVPIDLCALGADAVAVAAHKMGGPAGAGALFVRRGLDVLPLLRGGGQERGRRAGTPDVVTAAGFGAAAEAVGRRLSAMPRLAELRGDFEGRLCAIGATLQAAEAPRVATVTHAAFPGWKGAILAAALDVDGLCVSSGAACSSGLAEPSPVIRAMYPDEPFRAERGVRFSFGPETSAAEIEEAEKIVKNVLGRVGSAPT